MCNQFPSPSRVVKLQVSPSCRVDWRAHVVLVASGSGDFWRLVRRASENGRRNGTSFARAQQGSCQSEAMLLDTAANACTHKKTFFVTWSDRAWTIRAKGKSQGAFVAVMADEGILEGSQAKCSLRAAAEDSQEDLEYMRLAYSEMSRGPIDMRSPWELMRQIKGALDGAVA